MNTFVKGHLPADMEPEELEGAKVAKVRGLDCVRFAKDDEVIYYHRGYGFEPQSSFGEETVSAALGRLKRKLDQREALAARFAEVGASNPQFFRPRDFTGRTLCSCKAEDGSYLKMTHDPVEHRGMDPEQLLLSEAAKHRQGSSS